MSSPASGRTIKGTSPPSRCDSSAGYVDVADLPAMDSGIPRQAGLLLTIEGVSGPEDILDGVLVGNDNVDAVLLTEGNTLQVWVGVTAEVPFLVAEDESKIVLVLEN